jgi:hypothetical protein
MFCCKCQSDLDECSCDDLQERMAKVSGPGGMVAARWCATCDNHYAVCQCAVPSWKLRVNGVLQDIPEDKEERGDG